MCSSDHRCVVITFLVLSGLLPQMLQAQDAWLMKGHDARRTGQSNINGPMTVDPDRSWSATLPGALEINIGATVTRSGVFFGSWGLLRKDPMGRDARFWDKSDGKLYSLDPANGAALWGQPLDLDLTPRCYEFAGRQRSGQDNLWCPFTPYHVLFYNGTVEGQAAVDTSRNVLYVGRGDGKLYAIDPAVGRILWRYRTFNPLLPEDPDGGGEIISSPLLGPDGTIYFGTWGEGTPVRYETHAFYAVNPDSTLQWRYPSDTSLTHSIFASSALNPNNNTIYVGTYLDDAEPRPSTLYAFHRAPLGPASDTDRVKWSLPLEYNGFPVWTTTLAVGSDGIIYVGGFMGQGFGVPVLLAIEDSGTHPTFKWTTPYVTLRDGAQFVLGIALREVDQTTERLYVTTANLGTLLFNAKEEGKLYAVDPSTGTVLAEYDPSDDVPSAVGGINSPAIGANGVVYFGVRGRYGANAINGHYFAVTYDSTQAEFERLWSYEVDGHVEWNHPAIGPDGGLYVGSSVGEGSPPLESFDVGFVPPNTTPTFYAIKGPSHPVSSVSPETITSKTSLDAVFPNPFSQKTTLTIRVTSPSHVRLDVFDLLGRKVATLVEEHLLPGPYSFSWAGTNSSGRKLADGLYLAQLTTKDKYIGALTRQAHKLVLVK